jgi:hypothetical protein
MYCYDSLCRARGRRIDPEDFSVRVGAAYKGKMPSPAWLRHVIKETTETTQKAIIFASENWLADQVSTSQSITCRNTM